MGGGHGQLHAKFTAEDLHLKFAKSLFSPRFQRRWIIPLCYYTNKPSRYRLHSNMQMAVRILLERNSEEESRPPGRQ